MARRTPRLDTLDEGVRIAVDAIRTNRVRSGLTILGVAIGVGVVVTVAALITGIRSSVLEAFEAAGPDNFIVTPFDFSEVRLVSGPGQRPPWWDKPEITEPEVRRIGSLTGVREAIVDFDFSATIWQGSARVEGVQSSGNSAAWPAYSIGDFVAGRNFLPADVEHARPLVVLSAALAEELFGRLDPVGRRVRVSAGTSGPHQLFTVVGVYEIRDNIFADAVRHFAIFPWTAADKRLKARDRFNFLSVLVVPETGVPRPDVQDQVIGALRSMRGLGPGDDNDFTLVRSEQLVGLFNQLTGVFFLVMLALSSAGLMVGGIGVIGIMMISVTERTREIGIRKAVGATRHDILWQFLVEAGVLTTVGGALGMLGGAALAAAVARATPIPASIPLWSVGAALTMALLTGMLFGLLPAYRASRLDPVTALRHE